MFLADKLKRMNLNISVVEKWNIEDKNCKISVKSI